MKVLVTGAAGRTGSVVVRHLVEQGFDVVATDCFYRDDLPVKLRVSNLLDPLAGYSLLEGVEGVVHLANHPNAHVGEPKKIYAENVTMNMNVFGAAAEMGGKRIVFSSSIQSVIGKRQADDAGNFPPSQLKYLPLDGQSPANPGNHYALSKVASEQMLAYFVAQGRLDAVAIRFPFLISERFAHRIHRSDKVHINPDEGFSYLYTIDAASLVAATLRTDLPGFRTYFPCGSGTTSTRPIAQLINDFYQGVPLRKPVEELTSLVDITTITAQTGWRPLTEMPMERAKENPAL